MKSGHIGIEVTTACNLRCKMCFLSRHKAWKDELTTKEVMVLIDQFAKMNIKLFGITGGEPLLRKDIFTIINYAKDKGLEVRMVTNCTLITKKVARKLNLDGMRVSIDGLEETNDWNRGRGTFKMIMDAIGFLVDNEIRVDSNTIITRQNKDELFKLFNILSEIGVSSQTYSRPLSTGQCRDVYDKICLTTLELLNLKLKLMAYAKLKGHSISFDGGVAYFLNGCGIQHRNPFITSRGNVVPCCCFREKPIIGNVRESSYIDIARKYSSNTFHAPIKMFENCNDCLERI